MTSRGFLLLVVPIAFAGVLPAASSEPVAKPALAPATTSPATATAPAAADKPSPHMDKNGVPIPAWMKAHEDFVALAKKGGIDLYFIGDSITAGWQGKGQVVWNKEFGEWKPGNFGISGDQTQHVLWRLQNGELDGVSPKAFVVMIGTNNTPAGRNSEQEIASGVAAIVTEIQKRNPKAKILLLGLFPRCNIKTEDQPQRKIADCNALIAKLDNSKNVKYLDIGAKFLTAEGKMTADIMPDGLHLNEKGYKIWADAIKPVLTDWLGAPAREGSRPASAASTQPATKTDERRLMMETISVTAEGLTPFDVSIPLAPKGPVFDVRKYGAKGDGQTLDTEAIQKAVDACNAAGGGVVRLDVGVFLSGGIRLKSNVFLRIEEDATLRAWWPAGKKVDTLGASDLTPEQAAEVRRLFPAIPVQVAGDKGETARNEYPSPLIYAEDAERFGIIGDGVLHGQLRTMILFRCRNIRIGNIHVHNGRLWTLHFLRCDDVLVDGASLLTSKGGNNADGIDLDATRNAIVRNCHFETFDDCLALKSGTVGNDPYRGRPTENVLVENCSMYEGNGSIVLGSEMTGGIQNVLARNITAKAGPSCRIKTGAARQGFIRNVTFRDILSIGGRACSFEFGYAGGTEPEPGAPLPVIEKIRVENLQRCVKDEKYVTSFDAAVKAGTLDLDMRNVQRRPLEKPTLVPVVAGINGRLAQAESLLREGRTRETVAILRKLADRFGPFHAGATASALLDDLPAASPTATASRPAQPAPATSLPADLKLVQITSTTDGDRQPALFYCPASAAAGSKEPLVPLLVGLHTWSNDYTNTDIYLNGYKQCRGRQWAMIYPNYRGSNNRPQAGASDLAVQDILDAVEYAKANARIDPRRIYIMGISGGGHMALIMAGRAPQVWAGVSAWSSITDLKAWHERHKGKNYANSLEAMCGGPPGASAKVDAEYAKRSPLTHLDKAAGLPIDIYAGIHDGHTGSVPISHSLRAFNLLAQVNGQVKQMVSDEVIEIMTAKEMVPAELAAGMPATGAASKPAAKPAILFRREAGPARITIFDAGHTIDMATGYDWLADKVRR